MLADLTLIIKLCHKSLVLILVLLEYARRRRYYSAFNSTGVVLILVLLEYARRHMLNLVSTTYMKVLILVLLEYARRQKLADFLEENMRLNPCFTGICSPTWWTLSRKIFRKQVLILVLLEYARRLKL